MQSGLLKVPARGLTLWIFGVCATSNWPVIRPETLVDSPWTPRLRALDCESGIGGLFLLVSVEDGGDALGVFGKRRDAGALDLQ